MVSALVRAVVLAAAATVVAACAGPSREHSVALNQRIAAREWNEALKLLDAARSTQYGERDVLLYWLDKASVLHDAGRYAESDELLDLAERRMEELVPSFPAWGDLYDECLALAVSLGYGDHFMGAKGAQVSFIGHGLGVEIDEYPFIARGFHEMRIEPGMTFAFEPKAVYPGVGAAGIENTFLVTEDGVERLTFSPEDPVLL